MENSINKNSVDTKVNNARDGVTQIGKDLRAEAHSAVDRVADKVPPTTDRLAASAHTGIDKVADGVKSVSTSVADGVKSVSGSVESVSERVAARSKQVSEGYKKLAETGRSQVRASPAISVLIAAAAGYGISKLLNSRK